MIMKNFFIFLIYPIVFNICFVDSKHKAKRPYNETRPASRYDNPNFIRDRYRDEIWKPMMDEAWVNRFQRPFHPAYMDYCDPYHCNDYHKQACGINRGKMKFKMFQSKCHIFLNNMCSTYRGALTYDEVDIRYCHQYTMFLRGGCPAACPDELVPVCAYSLVDNHIALFFNKCYMERANCRKGVLEEYEEIEMRICSASLSFDK